MENKIDVFYTGGGVWLAEKKLSEETIAVVNSEHDQYLTIYKTGEDMSYLPEDMVYSGEAEQLNEEYAALYKEMVKELNNRK